MNWILLIVAASVTVLICIWFNHRKTEHTNLQWATMLTSFGSLLFTVIGAFYVAFFALATAMVLWPIAQFQWYRIKT